MKERGEYRTRDWWCNSNNNFVQV